MKVFISWSGTASRAVAEILADWFPKVLQGVQPFVSAKDIDKGANWTVELARELEDAQFGVICLAPDNLTSPWLNYEAGAITKSVESRVCPVLFAVEKKDVKPPISQLQMTAIDRADFTLLMNSMNRAAGNPLQLPAVKEAVDVWWPMLEEKIGGVTAPVASKSENVVREPQQPEASATEMLTELLQRVRQIDARLGAVESHSNPSRFEAESTVDLALHVLAAHGLRAGGAREGRNGIRIFVRGDLPDPLPGGLYDALGDVARTADATIRVSGENRTVTFDRSGMPDEPTF